MADSSKAVEELKCVCRETSPPCQGETDCPCFKRCPLMPEKAWPKDDSVLREYTFWPSFTDEAKPKGDVLPDAKSIFKYVGDGVFQVRHGKTFQFYHAYLTTGDRAKNRFHEVGQDSAGELWKKCNGGQSVTESFCSASNCTDSKCTPSSPKKARATAHIYHANQSNTKESIPYCMFIPTCSGCNNSGQTKREGTCWGYGDTRLSAYSAVLK